MNKDKFKKYQLSWGLVGFYFNGKKFYQDSSYRYIWDWVLGLGIVEVIKNHILTDRDKEELKGKKQAAEV